MDEKKCPTYFLSDEPAEKDAFGSHKCIAEAILNLISNNRADNVNAIALEGTWGSGKSTVIKILEQLIQNTNCGSEIAVFLYDTWAHQGDSLRRSFLERLIDFLIEKKWVDKKTWEEEKKLLARRKEDTTITSQPILTGWGKALAIFIGLVPAGIALATMNNESPLRWVGIAFTILPVIVASFAWVVNLARKPTKRQCSTTATEISKKNKEDEEVFSLFFQKIREVHKTKTARTPDPTSIEFSQKFTKLMQEALACESQNRRLLIVMDNLDRLPPEEALQAWATMRTFFETEQEGWWKRVHLLVPYAPEALVRLWKEESKENAPTTEAFIEKTFQVRFRVPPPVLADWHRFMKEQLEKAFPGHRGKPEIDIIIRLFRLRGIREDRPLTPRDIKLFINRLGAIHAQRGDEIPLHLQAAYVLYEKEIKDPSRDLATDNFLEENVKDLLQEREWQKYFAALYFNVHPEKALHVLIGQQVENALVEGNTEKIKKYKDIPGLEQVVGKIMDLHLAEWIKSQPDVLARIPIVLQEISDTLEPWDEMWNRIRSAIEQISKPLERFGQIEGNGFGILLYRYPEEALAKRLIDILKDSFPATSKAQDKKDAEISAAIRNWVHGAYAVLKKALELGFESVICESFTIPGDPPEYLEVVLTLAREYPDEEVFQYFVPSARGERIVKHLANSVKNGNIAEGLGKAVGIMAQIGSDWSWLDFISTVNTKTDQSKLSSTQHWRELLQALWNIKSFADQQAEGVLRGMAGDGRVLHYLYASEQGKDVNALAWNMFLLLLMNPTGGSGRIWNQSDYGKRLYNSMLKNPADYHKVVKEFAYIVTKHLTFEDLLKIYKDNSNTRKWIEASLEEILEKKPHFITPSALVEQHSAFQQLSPDLQNEIIKQFGSALVLELVKSGFKAEYMGLYNRVLETLESPKQSFIYFLKKGLQSINKDQWIKTFRNRDSLWRLLHALLRKGESLELSQAFSDALIEWTKGIMDHKTVIPEEEIPLYSSLPNALKDTARKTFWRDLRDLIIEERADQDLSILLEIFGEGLIDSEVLIEKTDDIIRRLFREVIERNVEKELQWMFKTLGRSGSSIVKYAQIESLQDFIERLEKLRDVSEGKKATIIAKWIRKLENEWIRRPADEIKKGIELKC